MNNNSWSPADDRYERMTYVRSGLSGLRLPQISLGLWHNFGLNDCFENARSILRRAFDLVSGGSIQNFKPMNARAVWEYICPTNS